MCCAIDDKNHEQVYREKDGTVRCMHCGRRLPDDTVIPMPEPVDWEEIIRVIGKAI